MQTLTDKERHLNENLETRLACFECDLLFSHHSNVMAGQRLVCPRCKHVLARGSSNALDTSLALSFTALLTLFLSIGFSFISFNAQGQANSVTIMSIAQQLYKSGFGILSLIFLLFLVLLPCVYLCSVFLLCLRVKISSQLLSPIFLAKLATRTLPWTMVDVFIFGVLIALIKMVGMADVALGASFWSYAVFVLVFIRVSLLVDKHQLWAWVDYAK